MACEGEESSSVGCECFTATFTAALVRGWLLALTSIAMTVSKLKFGSALQLARAFRTAAGGNPISFTSRSIAVFLGSTIGLTTARFDCTGGVGAALIGCSGDRAILGMRGGTRS